ncbi:hypothetical protein [Nocardia cyriacigeorgica]|nr:hypothetical protein [Nocardia cyriacigeorgica]
MIERRSRASVDCENRVRRALTKLTKTGVPFTIENICDLAGVGKTFIYDKRRPALTTAVLAARDASRATIAEHAEQRLEADTASWRERALNAEAVLGSLRATIRDRDARISDLTGQLYDPEGNHLFDENTILRRLLATLTTNLSKASNENRALQRSLDGARANVKRERERNVTQIFGGDKAPS